jgi:hypothetical protein
MRFSVSRIKTYMNCGLQAYFKYDLRESSPQNAAASFGSILHMALERFNQTGNFDEAMDMFQDYWKNPEKVGLTPDYWPKSTSWGTYNQLGVNVLTASCEAQRWDTREVVGTEVGFLVPFGDYWLTGFVDLLEIKKSGKGVPLLRIVDYKSAYRAPTKAELALDIQFTGYAWAVQQREFWCGVPGNPEFPGLPDGEELFERVMKIGHRCIWYHVRTAKEIDAGPREDADFMRMYRVMHEIKKSIDREVHEPKIGEACGLCDFKTQCPLEIPVSLDVRDDDEHAWI